MIALLLAALCAPDPTYSPTPTLLWDQAQTDALAGYTLYYREDGGPLVSLGDLPCEWEILDDSGIFTLRHCRGAEFDIPVQRYCPACKVGNLYEFTVKAIDLMGQRSLDYSNAVAICFPPICVPPGPCN